MSIARRSIHHKFWLNFCWKLFLSPSLSILAVLVRLLAYRTRRRMIHPPTTLSVRSLSPSQNLNKMKHELSFASYRNKFMLMDKRMTHSNCRIWEREEEKPSSENYDVRHLWLNSRFDDFLIRSSSSSSDGLERSPKGNDNMPMVTQFQMWSRFSCCDCLFKNNPPPPSRRRERRNGEKNEIS